MTQDDTPEVLDKSSTPSPIVEKQCLTNSIKSDDVSSEKKIHNSITDDSPYDPSEVPLLSYRLKEPAIVDARNNIGNRNHNDSDDDEDNDIVCGIGPCKPRCCQSAASTNWFLPIFGVALILVGAFQVYFVSVITTIQPIFQLDSKMIGMILSTAQFSQIIVSLFITYYGGQGHRPRWIGGSMILFSIASLIAVTPQLFYFNDPHQFETSVTSQATTGKLPDIFCDIRSNRTSDIGNAFCDSGDRLSRASETRSYVVGLFIISMLGIGVGLSCVSNLGIPYIDDNVTNKNSPLYIGKFHSYGTPCC